MEDFAEFAVVDEFLGQRHGRYPAIVVPDHVGDAGLGDGIDHFLALRPVHGQRLFAQDHLAVLGRGDGDVGMRVVRRADVDDVDVLAFHQPPPIGLDGCIAPAVGKRLGLVGTAGAHGLENRAMLQIEEMIDLTIRIGMSPAHEAVTDEANIQRSSHE